MIRVEFHDAAGVELTRALALDPRVPQAHALLGQLAVYRARLEDAVTLFRKAIEISPLDAMAHYRLGEAYARQQRWDEAIEALQHSIWINPFFSGPYIVLGRAYMTKGQPSTAEGLLRRAVEYDPNNKSAHYLLGQALQKLGREERCRQRVRASPPRSATRLSSDDVERRAAGARPRCSGAARPSSPAPPAAERSPVARAVPRRRRPRGLRTPSIYGGVDRKRFIIETNGAGVAWIDLDRDGWVDAIVLGGTRLAPGARHDDPAVARGGIDDAGLSQSARRHVRRRHRALGTRPHGLGLVDLRRRLRQRRRRRPVRHRVWHQRALPQSRRRPVRGSQRAPPACRSTGTRWGSGCSFLDYDRDGDLDLFVAQLPGLRSRDGKEPGQGVNCLWKGIPVNCGPKGLPTDTNLLYRNLGDGRFADVSEASGIARVRNRFPMSVVAADLDEDGWVDLYVASDSTAAIHYRNNRDGTFSDVAVARGTAFSENGMAQAGMGAAAGDINADGRLDLFKTHFADDIPALFRALGGGRFEEMAMAAGLGGQNRYVEWGAGMVDLDNDGWQDLLYVTGNVYPEVERQMPDYPHKGPRIVFRNRGGGSFEDVSATSGPGATTPRSSRGAAFGDFDNDGDVRTCW